MTEEFKFIKNLSIENLKKLNNKNGYIFKGDENNILILNPNECFHKAEIQKLNLDHK